MNHNLTRDVAGIAVPDTPLVSAAIEYARQSCEPYLLNHVLRSWLFAACLGRIRNIEHDTEVMALGTLLHDITLNERFHGPRRFEVEGADLAGTFAGPASTSVGLNWSGTVSPLTPRHP